MNGLALDIALTVNGEHVSERVEARKTLVDFLRDDLGLAADLARAHHEHRRGHAGLAQRDQPLRVGHAPDRPVHRPDRDHAVREQLARAGIRLAAVLRATL